MSFRPNVTPGCARVSGQARGKGQARPNELLKLLGLAAFSPGLHTLAPAHDRGACHALAGLPVRGAVPDDGLDGTEGQSGWECRKTSVGGGLVL